MPAELDGVLTDYALTLECGLMAWLVRRGGVPGGARAWTVLFFASIAAASLLGGTVHGFLSREHGLLGAPLWRATLIAIGTTTAAAWALGGRVMLPARAARAVAALALAELVAYAGIVLAIDDDFMVAVVNYAPSAVFLGVACLVAWRRARAWPPLAGAAGVGVLLAGSWVLVADVALHPTYFTANAVYHVVEGVALVPLYAAARWWTTAAV